MADTFTLALVQGERYERTLTFKEGTAAVPLTGLNLRSQVRTKADPTSELLLNLTSYLTVTDAAAGRATLVIPANVTAALPVGKFFSAGQPRDPGPQWDLFLIPVGDPTGGELWLQGPCTLDAAATNVLETS